MSSRNIKDLRQFVINRKAVYISGSLCTLYNQHEDRMRETLNFPAWTVKTQKPKIAQCELIRGQTAKSENLLQMISIEDDLRMSILLNLVPRTGLTSLIDYPDPINEYTRFLHCTYIRRREKLRKNGKKAKKQHKSSINQANATHIIHSVSWGMEFVAVLQLSTTYESTEQIDDLLESICSNLNGHKSNALMLTQSQKSVLERITDTHVYSNIPALASLKTIGDIYHNIYQFEVNKTDHQPIDFRLSPVQESHVQNNGNDNGLNSLRETSMRKIEQHLIQLSNSINYFKSFFIENGPDSRREDHKQQLDEANLKWKDVQKEYTDEMERLQKVIIDFRRGVNQTFPIEEALNDERHIAFIMKIDELTANIRHPETKEQPNNVSQKKQSPHCDTAKRDEAINILLLGESGVGKSTFINAFVNYLTFDTLKEAESNTPVVLIPVSFLITTGNDFEEHTVKFGDSDKTNNEDFDHPGQSVTQRCKSYVFDLHHTNGKKLRIIDTPGFGDTRGLDQDDLNMQYILQYVNNLTHLNTVCFLLKPNASQLNNFFRTCLIQLLDLLSPDARQNIIFCFTNARTTFFTPGDTAPLLRTLLGSMPMKDIPFKKVNTFCFDNESFRYLVALQNSIKFNEVDRNEYEKSWSTSVRESNRLRHYICNDLPVYQMHDQWKSIKHAQIEIVYMIRPILETIRNTLRNMILWDNDEKKNSIVFCPKAITYPSTVCLSCDRRAGQFNGFLIINDSSHECLSECSTCRCNLTKHMPIDHILHYQITSTPADQNRNRMMDQVSLLFNACIEFTHFLMSTVHSWKDDLVLTGLEQMIDDEKKICSDNKLNQLNGQLLEELKTLKNDYQRKMSDMKPNQNTIELADIYKRIQTARNDPGVHEQMDAVEKGQENLMKYYEHEIPNDSMSRSGIIVTAL